MTWLQYAARHVHHSVANYIETSLTALDWLDEAAVPFGATKVAIRTTPAFTGDTLVDGITAGTVAITIGDEQQPDPEELGGPLHLQEYPIFIDIFQDAEATALALACDVRDILLGRLPDTTRWLAVTNQATDTAVPGWKIEFDDVERIKPETRLPLHWQVVKVTAACYFPEVAY